MVSFFISPAHSHPAVRIYHTVRRERPRAGAPQSFTLPRTPRHRLNTADRLPRRLESLRLGCAGCGGLEHQLVRLRGRPLRPAIEKLKDKALLSSEWTSQCRRLSYAPHASALWSGHDRRPRVLFLLRQARRGTPCPRVSLFARSPAPTRRSSPRPSRGARARRPETCRSQYAALAQALTSGSRPSRAAQAWAKPPGHPPSADPPREEGPLRAVRTHRPGRQAPFRGHWGGGEKRFIACSK